MGDINMTDDKNEKEGFAGFIERLKTDRKVQLMVLFGFVLVASGAYAYYRYRKNKTSSQRVLNNFWNGFSNMFGEGLAKVLAGIFAIIFIMLTARWLAGFMVSDYTTISRKVKINLAAQPKFESRAKTLRQEFEKQRNASDTTEETKKLLDKKIKDLETALSDSKNFAQANKEVKDLIENLDKEEEDLKTLKAEFQKNSKKDEQATKTQFLKESISISDKISNTKKKIGEAIQKVDKWDFSKMQGSTGAWSLYLDAIGEAKAKIAQEEENLKTPKNPETPENPDTPGNSGTPENPGTPENQKASENPENSSTTTTSSGSSSTSTTSPAASPAASPENSKENKENKVDDSKENKENKVDDSKEKENNATVNDSKEKENNATVDTVDNNSNATVDNDSKENKVDDSKEN